MSRLGKLPIELPESTTCKIEGDFIIIKGQKGELKQKTHPAIKVLVKDKQIIVNVADPDIRSQRALWGLYRSLLNNMVIGVNQGFSKKLEINGVGYKASGGGQKILLNLGYSHPINFVLPDGLEAKVEANTITISGLDKQAVGETAAQIRRLRKPEPYKGKGIKYADEIIRRKAGKTAAGSK